MVGLIKNMVLLALAFVCLVLVARLWYGEFPPTALFPMVEGGVNPGINPWDEASAVLMLTSARLHIEAHGAEWSVYAGLSSHAGWQLATAAVSQLIERGNFAEGDAIPLQGNAITIGYNFPMPSTFFRENFGVRPGFLSSHFDDFEKLRIWPYGGGLYFLFTSENNRNFVFALENTSLYEDFVDFFANTLYEEDINIGLIGYIRYQSPIDMLSLSSVNPHISFLFPNPAAINQASINGIFTFSDNLRVARFFPNHVVEFNSMPSQSLRLNPNFDNDFTNSLLIAFDIISRDNLGNHIILSRYYYDAATGRWHFYFEYTMEYGIINLDEYPLKIQTLHRDVVFYRRLMLNFFEVEVENYEH